MRSDGAAAIAIAAIIAWGCGRESPSERVVPGPSDSDRAAPPSVDTDESDVLVWTGCDRSVVESGRDRSLEALTAALPTDGGPMTRVCLDQAMTRCQDVRSPFVPSLAVTLLDTDRPQARALAERLLA